MVADQSFQLQVPAPLTGGRNGPIEAAESSTCPTTSASMSRAVPIEKELMFNNILKTVVWDKNGKSSMSLT